MNNKKLNDNPESHWFKAKFYGWGWTPASWQGWVVIAIFIGAIALNAYFFSVNADFSRSAFFQYIARIVGIIFILLLICLKKGEKPHWQWGPPKDKNKL